MPSIWLQRLSVVAAVLAAVLFIFAMLQNYFTWLLAAVGFCVLSFIGLRQSPLFFTLDANGRGIWGSEGKPFMLIQPILSTPWLLMFQVRSTQEQQWLFIWQDSVSVASWCRLRRIAKALTSMPDTTTEGLK